MHSRKVIFIFCISLLVLNLRAEEYVWTAAGDGVSLYQEANWAYDGQNPDQINPGVAITYDLLVNSGTVGGGGFNGNLLLGGHRLTINGGQMQSQNSGIMSFDPSNEILGELIMTGGSLSCQFIQDINISISNTAYIDLLASSLTLEGSSINIDQSFTGRITLKNVNIEMVRSDYLSQITVGGNAAVENQNIYLSVKNNGTQISLEELEDELPISNKDYSDSPRPNDGPNIIFILLDDMGYGDLGSFWQNQRTGDAKMASPVLDQLAKEGAMMTQHYCAAPVCAPSRASLLEGLHQGHSSVRDNQFDKALKEGLGMAGMLQKAGYRTMHVGKYGLAGGRNSDLEGHPLRRGFDQYFGYLFHSQGHTHYPQDGTTSKEAYFTDGSTPIFDGTMLTYTTDVFTAKSKQWIEEHHNTRSEQPFFLYLAYDVPHFALDVPTVAYPEGRGLDGGVQWTGEDSETPWVNTATGERNAFIHPDYQSKDWSDNEKKFATMMRRVDNACDDLLQTLKDLDIDDHTLIVFTSDNGPHIEGGRDVTFFQSYAFLNGIKRDMWEGGIRMGTIARYPGVIPENTEHAFPSGHWDWMATFAELAGVAQPVYTDGVSLMPSLKQEEGQRSKGYLYHEYYNNGSTPTFADFGDKLKGRKRNQMQVLRIGDYKGVRYDVTSHDDDFEIYDIVNDPRESNNLASSMTELQQQMKDKSLQVRRVDASAQRPYDNELIPGCDIEQLSSGIQKNIYDGKQMWVPDFELLSPSSSLVVKNINASTEGRDSLVGLFYTGYLEIETAGSYTFYMESSSSSHMKIHDIHLLDNDFTFTDEEISARLNLDIGFHPIRIYYQQNEEVETKLSLKVSGPGMVKQSIPESMLFYLSSSNVFDEKIIDSQDINVYPQPVKSTLFIDMNYCESTDIQVSVYTLDGKLLKSCKKQFTEVNSIQQTSISVVDLPAGIYILSVQGLNKDKNCYKKFVKY